MTNPPTMPPGPSSQLPMPPAGRNTRRRLWLAIGVMLGCAAIIVVATVFVVFGGSTGNDAGPSSDTTPSSSAQELSYQIPSDFCSEKIISLFEDVPEYKPGYSKGFEESEIDVDAKGISDKARCAGRSVDAGVDVYLFENTRSATEFYEKNIDSEMQDLDVEDLDKSEWSRGSYGFGIELSKPHGVVIAQKGQLVVGTSVQLDVGDASSEDAFKEGFGEALIEIARVSEAVCRK